MQAEQEFLSCFELDKPSAYIEELIALGKPFIKVLRLICLQCICSSGLKPKVLEGYKRELVQVVDIDFSVYISALFKFSTGLWFASTACYNKIGESWLIKTTVWYKTVHCLKKGTIIKC